MSDAATRIAELRAEIRRHDHAYFVDDNPTVDDATYDALMRELRALEAANPDLVEPDSPTQRVVGGLREGLVEVRHLQPMLSLANARDESELQAWDERVRRLLQAAGVTESPRYVTEAKIDGLAISLIYREGIEFPAPATLYGYGAYESSEDPRFSVARLSLLDRGMVFAIAHVRGGGELGRPWYEGGKLLEKKNY